MSSSKESPSPKQTSLDDGDAKHVALRDFERPLSSGLFLVAYLAAVSGAFGAVAYLLKSNSDIEKTVAKLNEQSATMSKNVEVLLADSKKLRETEWPKLQEELKSISAAMPKSP